MPPPSDDTLLGAGDVFDVNVYDEEALSGSYRVAQDGTINFPFVGRVEVAGLEPPRIADALARRLRDGHFLQNPQVSVFVREYNSKRVSVLGAVQHPGAFPISSGMTVVQAISQAGGFTAIASRNDVTISREIAGELHRIPVAAADIAEGNMADLPVQAGDIIFVPERIF